ncbi:hypothetical protein Taro_013158 [Colocasia esculenta]|uniref:Uncharacterized protein n=1 Tax=Colocasia esculenta TaxID=4460 RepID=A0A843UEU0_COLES|nr:hypothetical protein [Colocasia esculenta]
MSYALSKQTFSWILVCKTAKDMWDKLKLAYGREPIVVEVQDKEDTGAQISEEAKDERIESVAETEEARTHGQEESEHEAPQEDILPHEEEDIKEEPHIEGEPQIFLKEEIPEDVSVKKVSDEEEAEEAFQTYLRGVLHQKGEDLVLLLTKPRSEVFYIDQFFN